MRYLLIWMGMLLLVACGGGETAVSSPPRATAITCYAAYRSSVSQPIEREDQMTFADRDAEDQLAFDDLVLHGAYATGAADNERSLRLWVSDGTVAAVFHSQLYQFHPDSGPQNQFVGGHGFTGLTYSYHPTSQAELQFWCTAE